MTLDLDATITRLDDKPICTKPGCGARAILARPCHDFDCPQRYLSDADRESLIERSNALVTRARAHDDALKVIRDMAVVLEPFERISQEWADEGWSANQLADAVVAHIKPAAAILTNPLVVAARKGGGL